MLAPRPARFVCVHGHFYQPPRENPWLGAIETQDSAAPFHDWNERVTAECYAPNTVARLLDEGGRVVALRNNYRDISFNFGPTLLSWMERARPDVYASILDADGEAQRRYGRGNALAQVYGHCILPLAVRRDQLTQVRWGIADFVHRFRRRPDGMWLPETAVDTASLRALAENGIRFTILAPAQAARVRYGDGPWQDVRDGSIDPSRPYRCDLGGGLSMTLFFYDGGIAHAVAFAGLLDDGRELARRLTAIALGRPGTPLVHFATDGESYGHHHRFGEMALAAALQHIEDERQVEITNYAAYLDRVPVTDSVEIAENTSWSCAHGVERWRSNCGCNTGHPGWQQTWRAPLRESLDWLKEQVDGLFERQSAGLIGDPWAARDAYVQVLLQRDRDHRNAFLHHHARPGLHAADRSRVWKLLELQRNALLSFTSCGWFFDEPSGLETVQILTYAARALQLARDLGTDLEPQFLVRLAALRSNLPQYPDGTVLYDRLVRPAITDARRVVAHYAMGTLFDAPAAETRSYVFRIRATESARERADGLALSVGRAHLVAEVTEDSGDFEYAALHFGGQDMQCAVIAASSIDGAALRNQLLERFRTAPLADLVRFLDEHYDGPFFSLSDMFVAERRRILDRLTGEAREAATAAYERIVNQNRRLIEFLVHSGTPIPAELRVAAGFVVQCRFDRAVERLVRGEVAVTEAAAVLGDSDRWGLGLDRSGAARTFEAALAEAVGRLQQERNEANLESCHRLLDAAAGLNVSLNVAAAQNVYYALWQDPQGNWPASLLPSWKRLGERLHFRLVDPGRHVDAA